MKGMAAFVRQQKQLQTGNEMTVDGLKWWDVAGPALVKPESGFEVVYRGDSASWQYGFGGVYLFFP